MSSQGRMTPAYCAPELLINGTFSKKTDIWALGCIFFEELMACLDRRKAFPSIVSITSYYLNESIPPPQITWQSLGINPWAIPMDCRGYRAGVERQWEQINVILAAMFRRKPDEPPIAERVLQNLRLIRNGENPDLPDYRPAAPI
jgi:serine/threonine protein kinase